MRLRCQRAGATRGKSARNRFLCVPLTNSNSTPVIGHNTAWHPLKGEWTWSGSLNHVDISCHITASLPYMGSSLRCPQNTEIHENLLVYTSKTDYITINTLVGCCYCAPKPPQWWTIHKWAWILVSIASISCVISSPPLPNAIAVLSIHKLKDMVVYGAWIECTGEAVCGPE